MIFLKLNLGTFLGKKKRRLSQKILSNCKKKKRNDNSNRNCVNKIRWKEISRNKKVVHNG